MVRTKISRKIIRFKTKNELGNTMNKMPVLFVGHGSPMNALDAENPFNQGFRRIAQKFAKPKAILMISAHWYGNRLQVTSGERPEMIYDFYGFPAALSQVQYPAPGSPELAEQVRSLLQPENVEMNPERGLDHGAWAALKHLYPEADIPVVQLGLNLMQPAQWHFDLAKKLTPLREQGVLVVGSGNIVHNLRAMRREPAAGYDWAIGFRNAVNRALAARDNDTLVHYERLGEAAVLSVPSPEHYLPLLYTAALREPQDNMEIFNDEFAFSSISMTSVLIG